MDTTPIREILADFENRLAQEKEDRQRTMRAGLEDKGISGSAVIANVAADPEWILLITQVEQALKEKLNERIHAT